LPRGRTDEDVRSRHRADSGERHVHGTRAAEEGDGASQNVRRPGDEVSGRCRFCATVAKAAFRAPDPIRAARTFIADYDAIVEELATKGVESQIARSLAGIASLAADPVPTARKLLQNFEDVLEVAKKTHPWVARSIALSACRASDPLTTARSYMKNYDTIVCLISGTDERRAREVAAQSFRSDNPLRWAKRYLTELREGR
jgi:hypothetical protein